nr:unnamed protein product [Callosobruchus chinensis]
MNLWGCLSELRFTSKLIGECDCCQRYLHDLLYFTAPLKCLKCAQDHKVHLSPQAEQGIRKCVKWVRIFQKTIPSLDSCPGGLNANKHAQTQPQLQP